jgi:WD40 repeat protein
VELIRISAELAAQHLPAQIPSPAMAAPLQPRESLEVAVLVKDRHLETITAAIPQWGSILNHSSSRPFILTSGSYDETIRIWDAETGATLRTLQGHSNFVFSTCFCPDGHYIASGSWDSSIRIWDAETGATLRTLQGHSGYIYSTCFSPDGHYIASGSWDSSIRIWDAETGANLRTLQGHSGVVRSVSYGC